MAECECERCEGTGRLDCALCAATGIGQHGDPDTSRCNRCGGRGWVPCPECADRLDAEREDWQERYADERRKGL